MKKVLVVLMFTVASSTNILAQTVLDTIYFVDGKKEAVQLTGLSDNSVQYNYYGEGIPISTPKDRLDRVVTRSGRSIVFENTSKKKTVHSAEDWDNVEITNVESEVEGLIRIANVSGKSKGMSTFSSLEKMQNRAMTKMRMQAAFLGCDVIYMLNQTNTDSRFGSSFSAGQAPSSTLSGTSYSVSKVNPFNISDGKYELKKVLRLRPNEYELYEIPFTKYSQEVEVDKNDFFKGEDYYSFHFDTKIPNSKSIMHLIKVSDNELVFLVIDRSKQSKIKYYNLYFSKK